MMTTTANNLQTINHFRRFGDIIIYLGRLMKVILLGNSSKNRYIDSNIKTSISTSSMKSQEHLQLSIGLPDMLATAVVVYGTVGIVRVKFQSQIALTSPFALRTNQMHAWSNLMPPFSQVNRYRQQLQ